jgi:hypothetical protein
MQSDQWFTLWVTVISVAGGCVAAFISVWLGASLALRGNRKSLQHERARTASERCLMAIDQAAEEYRRMERQLTLSEHIADTSASTRAIEQFETSYNNLAESELGHEAWLLEDKSITFAIAECLQRSLRLHLDSFGGDLADFLSQIEVLNVELRTVGDMLRAAMLDKRVSKLTDQDRYISRALLPGRHIRKND